MYECFKEKLAGEVPISRDELKWAISKGVDVTRVDTPRVKKMKSIILSIHPQWAQEIYAGNKTFEFRRVFSAHVKRVFLYETAPIQKITGVFEAGFITEAGNEFFLENTLRSQKSSMTIKELLSYKGDREFIKTISILNPRKFKKPLDMEMAVPQNFRYISNRLAGIFFVRGFGVGIYDNF